jgi:hypothetical protein
MLFSCFRKEVVLAAFAAKPQVPITVADKTKFPATRSAAVLDLGHDSTQISRNVAVPRNMRRVACFAIACQSFALARH